MKTLKKSSVLIILLIALMLVGCSSVSTEPTETAVQEDTTSLEETTALVQEPIEKEKISIITSLFPQYDFAKTIAGDFADVSLILPPGIESHSYEPTPKDIIKITESDLFIYTNEIMEPWAHSLIENIETDKTKVVDLSIGIELLANSHSHEEGDHEHEEGEEVHEEGEYDPHYWLDPQNAIIMVSTIRDALIEVLPAEAEVFNANAQILLDELQSLDTEIAAVIEKTDSKTILSGGHFAFGYFAHRYGLENLSPYVGFSPDAEPTPQRIAELIDTISETGAKAIFYEELIDPRVAKVISDEADVEMLLLHGAHNVSKDEIESGITYIEIMKGNLERLKIGLGYHE